MNYRVLAINPGSTSTKIAVYDDENLIFEKSISHSAQELAPYNRVIEQFEFRRELIISVVVNEGGIPLDSLSAVVGRGGMLPNMKGGGYRVNQAMQDIIWEDGISPHASNLGAILAHSIAEPQGIPAYIYDAVTSDELTEVAKITGMPEITKQSLCHVLNMKAVARKVAAKYGKKYEDMNMIIAHLGGGLSLSVHHGGRIVDCIRDDEGPFAPERSGGIPALYMIDLCYSGEYTKQEMVKKVRGKGGFAGYLETQDLRDVLAMIEKGDKKAELLFEAMTYQIAKGIGTLSPVLSGNYDCIVLTGGMAYSEKFTEKIAERVKFIAPVEIVPGENEMEALAFGALRLVSGQEEAKEYVRV